MIARAVCAAILAAGTLQAPFRSRVDVVEVDVSVMRGGTPVAGLTAANFTLTDNGVVQEVTSATLDRLPLNVIQVLDTSSSVAGEKLTQLIAAGQRLVRSLHGDDRAALVTFSQDVHIDVPLTRDTTSVARALASLEGRGATSLIDAVHVALLLRPIDATRSVVIVFTDGDDNLSWLTGSALVDEARRLGVVIHAIELRQELSPISPGPGAAAPRSRGGANVLRPLTAAAGGRVWSATASRELEGLFTRALDEMRARYLLTFTPTGVAPDGWHELKVSLRNARGEVTARPGYFAASKDH